MNKKAYAFFLKKNRSKNKQNPIAQELSDGRYHQRVVKNKKVYDRKKFNLKDQLAGIAALIAAIVAIGGGFVKYGEITTKLDALEAQEQSVVDTSGIESSIAVLQEKVSALESQEGVDISDLEEGLNQNKTKSLVNAKEIELLKVQIEEIKVSTSNPLTN